MMQNNDSQKSVGMQNSKQSKQSAQSLFFGSSSCTPALTVFGAISVRKKK
jgi:hypothetical protein